MTQPHERFAEHLDRQLADLDAAGLTKRERALVTPQRPRCAVEGRGELLNLCANNYLGMADHPEVVAAAKRALDRWGFGTASVRFICGTQSVHLELERALTAFLRTDATILYGSAFDANGGLFETVLGPEDAVVSDELNHASIIDGVRLCKAKRYRYRNNDMGDLRAQLEAAKDARFRMIATDGVFSMDGTVADLPAICELADEHDALVMVDDCHATGFYGPTGRGTHEHFGVEGRVDVITGTLGKGVAGGAGGFTSGRRAVVDLLRQRSRPYLFSNALPPSTCAAALRSLELLTASTELRDKLWANTRHWRGELARAGFDDLRGDGPIVPVMLGDARVAGAMAARLADEGVFATAFSFPVVPQGKARIRTQVSAAHDSADLTWAAEAFARARAVA